MADGAGGVVSGPARLLGYAGLLPQAALLLLILGLHDPTGIVHGMAFFYAALIFSFIGGIWWGFAMRSGSDQGRIATMAVLPSLFGALLILLSIAHILPLGLALVLMGSAVIMTLLIDRRLVDAGCAPGGWMALRVPLSIGLGGLTILCGIVCSLSVS